MSVREAATGTRVASAAYALGVTRYLCVGLLLSASCWAQSTISVDVRLVNSSFSVRDASGALVKDLEKEDFELLEDGIPQKISFLARGTDLPLHLGLLVDLSGSQEEFVKEHRRDLRLFLDTLLDEGDKVEAVCFARYVRVVSDDVTDGNVLLDRIRDYRKGDLDGTVIGPEERRSGASSFFDALYHSLRERLSTEEAGRRAIVVLSDGDDTASVYNLMDVVEEAQNADVRVYGIWYAEPGKRGFASRDRYGQRVMERIAAETGGERMTGANTNLGAQFQRIAEELRSSYTLRYYSANPSADGRFRRLEIRPKRKGLTVRSKAGYFAR